jgi:hypothetical protein
MLVSSSISSPAACSAELGTPASQSLELDLKSLHRHSGIPEWPEDDIRITATIPGLSNEQRGPFARCLNCCSSLSSWWRSLYA